MTADEAIRKYALPGITTIGYLAGFFDSRIVESGDMVLFAGYRHTGLGRPCYYGAAYGYLDSGKHDPDSGIRLLAASDAEFWDQGYAMAWVMEQIK